VGGSAINLRWLVPDTHACPINSALRDKATLRTPMRETPEEIATRYIQEATAPAKEVREHIHNAVLALPEFTLKDSTKARTSKYEPPQINDNGELTCSFNVNLDNGTDLTFTVKDGGWGKYVGPPAKDSPHSSAVQKKGKPGRRR